MKLTPSYSKQVILYDLILLIATRCLFSILGLLGGKDENFKLLIIDEDSN